MATYRVVRSVPDYLSRWNYAAEDALWQRLVWGREHPIATRALAEAKRCRDLYLAMSPRRDVLAVAA